jgi:hypothetical protein
MEVIYSVLMEETFLRNFVKLCWRFLWSSNNYRRLIVTTIKYVPNFMLDLQYKI